MFVLVAPDARPCNAGRSLYVGTHPLNLTPLGVQCREIEGLARSEHVPSQDEPEHAHYLRRFDIGHSIDQLIGVVESPANNAARVACVLYGQRS